LKEGEKSYVSIARGLGIWSEIAGRRRQRKG